MGLTGQEKLLELEEWKEFKEAFQEKSMKEATGEGPGPFWHMNRLTWLGQDTHAGYSCEII